MDSEAEAAIIGDFVPVEDIEEQEKIFRQSKAEGRLTDEVAFNYAWHLVKSQYKKDINKGIKLMEDLIKPGSDQRHHYYYMALGHYKLQEYDLAKNCIDRVLQMEPNNHQAQDLKKLIAKKIRRDGLLGLGVLGGAAALGGVIAVGAVALAAFGLAKATKK